METNDIVLLAVTLLILGEVTYLLAKLPKTSIKSKDRAILVDTSVLMDGRITRVAATGFIGGTLVVPRSVVGELQFLADHADADKRARARYGLDVVSELQNMETVEVEILQDGSKAEEGVDDRLLTLAKRHNAVICTLDFNLNKVAVVEGIRVLNINELAQSLRMQYLPGEQMIVELTQKGQDSHQGVGYLADGTMVVVEQAHKHIGQSIQVEVVRSLQTAAGKMMFARPVERHTPKQPVSKKAEVVAKRVEAKQPAAAHPKPAGRSQSPQASHRRANDHHKAHQPQQPKVADKPQQQPAARPTQNRSRRRVDHEDNLLKLVNGQKDS